ncbi:hypothetical protein GCM10029992_36740 [Glycomyces albus]
MNRRSVMARRRRGTPLEADLWPDTAFFELRRYRCGDGWGAVFLVTGYPAVLSWGWLGHLAGAGARVNLALHLDGVPAAVAAMQLQRRRARLESQRRYQAARGRLEDPEVEAAAEDAADLAAQVSRGRAQLHKQAVYLTVHAETTEALDLTCARVRSRAAGTMIDLRPATARQPQGVLAAAPFGIDPVGAVRTVDTASASAAFPFASPDIGDPVSDSAVLYGLNLYSGSPVLWDRWDTSVVDNHNSITIARSGAGKSYLTKCEILRQLYQGVRVIVVDPESEYLALAAHVGGTVHRPGTVAARLNPFPCPSKAKPTRSPAAASSRSRSWKRFWANGWPGPRPQYCSERVRPATRRPGSAMTPRPGAARPRPSAMSPPCSTPTQPDGIWPPGSRLGSVRAASSLPTRPHRAQERAAPRCRFGIWPRCRANSRRWSRWSLSTRSGGSCARVGPGPWWSLTRPG